LLDDGCPRSHAEALAMTAPAELRSLCIADEPATWTRLGFAVGDDGRCTIGGIALELAGRGAGTGIVGWTIAGLAPDAELDGLPTTADDGPAPADGEHPNGAVAVDHVVVTTPDVRRTFAALARAGLDLRREREAGTAERPMRQGFYVLGGAVLEVVGPAAPSGDGSAAFWGMVLVVPDLVALAARLGADLGTPRDAVQQGRRIAPLREDAGSSVALAFMTPRPGADAPRPRHRNTSD
jgi:hypothetical protein